MIAGHRQDRGGVVRVRLVELGVVLAGLAVVVDDVAEEGEESSGIVRVMRLPILVAKFGADPAIVGAIGMLSGFCGTLMTPMAATFNVVPVALLELKDRDGVIKAQIPTALPLLLANTVLMYVLAFRF